MPGTLPPGTIKAEADKNSLADTSKCPAADMMIDVLKAHFHAPDNPYLWCHFNGIAPDPQNLGYSNQQRSYGSFRHKPDEHVVAFFGDAGQPITHWLAPFETPTKTAHDLLKKERHIQTAQRRIHNISVGLKPILDAFDTIQSFTLIISPMISSPKLYITYTDQKTSQHFYGGRLKKPY